MFKSIKTLYDKIKLLSSQHEELTKKTVKKEDDEFDYAEEEDTNDWSGGALINNQGRRLSIAKKAGGEGEAAVGNLDVMHDY